MKGKCCCVWKFFWNIKFILLILLNLIIEFKNYKISQTFDKCCSQTIVDDKFLKIFNTFKTKLQNGKETNLQKSTEMKRECVREQTLCFLLPFISTAQMFVTV